MRKTFRPTNDMKVVVSVKPYDDCGEGRQRWDYTMTVNGKQLFSGHDFSSPRCWAESQVISELLGFLTLRPGDTDDEYFIDYTDEQMAWAQSDACEALQSECVE